MEWSRAYMAGSDRLPNCFDYGVYYSPVSTPADFVFFAPVVLEQALKKAGTQLLEPYLSFTLFVTAGISFTGL